MANKYSVLPQQSVSRNDYALNSKSDDNKIRPLRRALWLLAATIFVGAVLSLSRRSQISFLGRDSIQPRRVKLPFHMDTATSHSVPINKTLGFQQIYVLSMPNRRDKRAEQTLLADLYGYKIKFVDGFNVAAERPDLDTERMGELGCAEGHAHIWQMMLQDDVKTALIFEDDFDFSRHLKAQLQLLQEPLATFFQAFTGNETSVTPSDPYNSAHWDTIWLGHCGDRGWNASLLPPRYGDNIPYLSYDDPTRNPVLQEKVAMMFQDYKFSPQASKTSRIIQTNRDTWCLSGYAMTAPGARKALYKNAHKGALAAHIDWDVMMLVRERRLRSFSLSPPLFAHRQPVHGEDSDRSSHHSQALPGREGITQHIGDDSARKHLYDDIMVGTYPLMWEQQRA